MLTGGGTTPAPREVAWNLDTLGNWNGQTLTGGSPLHGRVVAGDTSVPPDGVADATTVTRTDTTDFRNRILSQQNSGSASVNFVYDRVGNLVSDGAFFCQGSVCQVAHN